MKRGEFIILIVMCSAMAQTSCEKKSEKLDKSLKLDAPKTRHTSRISGSSHDELRKALDAALKIETKEIRIQAIVDVAWKSLKKSGDVFNDSFREIPSDCEERENLLRAYIAQLLTTKGPQAALLWANSLDSEIEATTAREQIALNLAESTPTDVEKFLPTSSFQDGHGSPAVVEAVQRWTLSAPSGAAAWASKLPPGKERHAGLEAVIEQWIETDPPMAISWVNSVRDTALRSEVLAVVSEIIEKQPQPTRDIIIEHADEQTRAEIQNSSDSTKFDNNDEGTEPHQR